MEDYNEGSARSEILVDRYMAKMRSGRRKEVTPEEREAFCDSFRNDATSSLAMRLLNEQRRGGMGD